MAAVPVATPEIIARDRTINWYRSEFAAANAIIDVLCDHIVQISGDRVDVAEYESFFAALHSRRINWFHLIYMQEFISISDVTNELYRVVASRAAEAAVSCYADEHATETAPELQIPATEDHQSIPAKGEAVVVAEMRPQAPEANTKRTAACDAVGEEADGVYSSGDSSERKETEDDGVPDGTELQGEESIPENLQFCSDHEDCLSRPDRMRTLKGFVAKEPVKGHMVNVVKGLKIYEEVFTISELLKLSQFIGDVREAGRNGELSGETYIFFNKEMKGNKREIIQLGVPLFQPTSEEASSSIEPIPPLLQAVVDHLVLWRLIPESRKPNSCIINFFDEDEYSQPYFKPPHLDNPITTLFLSETSMAFGRALVSNLEGNYKGSLALTLKKGSLAVMRGNSADMARHVICASSNQRVSITFVKVRPPSNHNDTSAVLPSPAKVLTDLQPGTLASPKLHTEPIISYGALHTLIPSAWRMALPAPLVMVAPTRPDVAMSANRKMTRSGTGVFLPWTISTKKYKHLPPRIQKRRFSSLMSTSTPIEAKG